VSRRLVIGVEECASAMIPTNFRWDDSDASWPVANDKGPIVIALITWEVDSVSLVSTCYNCLTHSI
jgi:hypothetical protein